MVNDEDDSDESDEDDEKPDKNMSKKDGRKSFMREANESGNLSKGFQQVIVQPPIQVLQVPIIYQRLV